MRGIIYTKLQFEAYARVSLFLINLHKEINNMSP